MKILKKLGFAIAALAIVFVLGGFVLPAKFATQRSTTINAPADKVFAQVNNLQANEAWSPWKLADPTMTFTYSSTAAVGVGAWVKWTSKESGDGQLTIKESVAGKRIVNDLDFMEQGKGTGIWTFEPAGDKTKVTWAMEGESSGLIEKWFGLMIDTFVGPSFESGLKRLKEVSEKS